MSQNLLLVSCPLYDPDTETIEEFLERFSMLLEGDGKKKSDKALGAFLIRALPVQMVTDLQRRLAPKKLTETSFDELTENLLQAHSIRKSVVGTSVKFFTYKQQTHQNIEDYSKELRFLASKCNFEQDLTVDRLLRDVFIAGINSSHVMSAVLQSADKLTFSAAVEKAKLIQQVRDDTAILHQPHQHHSNVHATQDTDYNDVHRIQSDKLHPGYVCMRCGAKCKHHVDKCYAKTLECRLCHKIGHIQAVCRSSGRQRTLHVRESAEANSVHQMRGSGSGASSDWSATSQGSTHSAVQRSREAPYQQLHTLTASQDATQSTVQRASEAPYEQGRSLNNLNTLRTNASDMNDPEHFLF